MSITFKEIQTFIHKKEYLYSEHADAERTKDQLTVQEIEEAVLSGEIIEERLDDTRGESRLIAGKSKTGRLIHTVIGLRFNKPLIVTVYTPGKDLWTHGTIRTRKRGTND